MVRGSKCTHTPKKKNLFIGLTVKRTRFIYVRFVRGIGPTAVEYFIFNYINIIIIYKFIQASNYIQHKSIQFGQFQNTLI